MDGNITRKGNTYYYWSADGLLDSVIAGTTKLRYEYDATGRLVRKSRNGTVQRHLMWDDLQLLAELNATAKERVGEYVYLPGIDRPMMLVTGETSVTNKFQLVLDQIGNVIGAVNDGSYSMRYDPWGRRSQETGTLAAVNRLTWKGLFWEGDSTRLYYARNRWYDPDVGRFVTEDPLGLSSGINLYVFAFDDPLNASDPLGLSSTDSLPPHPRNRSGCNAWGSSSSCDEAWENGEDEVLVGTSESARQQRPVVWRQHVTWPMLIGPESPPAIFYNVPTTLKFIYPSGQARYTVDGPQISGDGNWVLTKGSILLKQITIRRGLIRGTIYVQVEPSAGNLDPNVSSRGQ